MRATIEIPDHLHETLLRLARRRGLRGFSRLVEEALDSYLADLSPEETRLLLSLESSIDESEEQEMRRRIEEARTAWWVS